MRKRITNLTKRPFIRNVIVLASGTAAAQFVGLISSPVVTRLYGPEAFGIMGVFMAIIQMLTPIVALTYPIAIVLPKNDKNAKNLIRLSMYICITFAIIVSIILSLFNEFVVNLFQIQEVSKYLILIPLVIVFAGLLQVSEQWLIRTKQFGINAKVAFLQSVLINASKIGIGTINPIASVLIVLSASANGLRAIMMMLLISKSNYKQQENQHQEKVYSIIELAKRYKDFPLYRSPEVLVNAVSQRLPVLLLTSFFGPAVAGFYTLGNTVLQQPIRLIGTSVGDVFYPRITEAAHNKESLTKLIRKSTLALAGMGIIPFGLIIFFGPWIFSFAFGSDWIMAGKYAQWIGLFLFCEFINKPSVKSLPVLSAQLFHLNFTVVVSVIRIISLIIGYYIFSSDLIAIALFGVSSAISHIILIISVIKRSKVFDSVNLG